MRLFGYFYSSQDPANDRYLFIVSELMPETLSAFIKRAKAEVQKPENLCATLKLSTV